MSETSHESSANISTVELDSSDFDEQRRLWLIAAQSGDENAKAQLCMSYRHEIYTYVSSRPNTDPDTAEDITQTALLRLWTHDIQHFNDLGDGLMPLAITIAKNIWLDDRRSARHTRNKPVENIALYGDVYFPTKQRAIEQEVDNRSELQDIIGKIATYISQNDINPDTMMALLLFADGYSDAEIAEFQHVTTVAVRQRVFRARAHIKRLLLSDKYK